MMVTDDDLQAGLAMLYQQMRRRFDRAMTEQGVSLTRAKMLMCIKFEDGDIRAADLAERLGIAPRTVTEALDTLERDGLITRVPDPGDRRVKRLALTVAGQAAIAIAEPYRKQLAQELFGVLDEQERSDFHSAIRKLLHRIQTY